MNEPDRTSSPLESPDREYPRLAAGMMRLHADRAVSRISPEHDQAMRSAIRTHFDDVARGGGQLRTLPWRAVAGLGGLAAAVALATWLGLFTRQSTPPASRPALAQRQPADIDDSGHIDILDAFALARMLETKQGRTETSFDLNDDGTVDQRDVDAIAMQAVALKTDLGRTGGRSS